MTSGPEPEHLDDRHRDTLRQIFQHPAGRNMDWRAVMSLLEAVGDVTVRHDGKVTASIPACGRPTECPDRQEHAVGEHRPVSGGDEASERQGPS
jgi:hypothetical protein